MLQLFVCVVDHQLGLTPLEVGLNDSVAHLLMLKKRWKDSVRLRVYHCYEINRTQKAFMQKKKKYISMLIIGLRIEPLKTRLQSENLFP